MAGAVEARLAELGIDLPAAPAPAANYVPAAPGGGLMFISGQGPRGPQGATTGKVGADLSVEEGQAAARMVGLNLIAQMKAAAGDLDRVRVVKLFCLVNSAPDFEDQPKVVNGASDLLVEVFGDRGRHARSAVSAPSLPSNIAVEIEAVIVIE